MRTITITFSVPEEVEKDYSDVCAELVVEDFFQPLIGFSVIHDSEPKKVSQQCKHSAL
jgi:hypothetical protein